MNNTVALVGHPSVGKSTLFNRLVGKRSAIVDPAFGITRDRHYDLVEWCGRTFTLIDTGGYGQATPDYLTHKVMEQIVLALKEASIVLFVVDCQIGVTPEDEELAALLRKQHKKVILIANKADNATIAQQRHLFHSLGFGEPHPVSATHGSGTGDLLDYIIAQLTPGQQVKKTLYIAPKIALIGRANVGKSTLLNAFLGRERSIVDKKPHTTRIPIDSYYHLYHKHLVLIDTAGIARKKQTPPGSIEYYAIIRSIKAIERSDVCVLLIDARESLTKQDQNILNLAQRRKKGLVLLVNKWDLMDPKQHDIPTYRQALQKQLASMQYIPILFTSGKTKKNLYQAIEKAVEVYNNRQRVVNTATLNQTLHDIIQHHPTPTLGRKSLRCNYAVQLTQKAFPVFAIFCNEPTAVPTHYKRFLENQFRFHFTLEGVPLTLEFRKK